jgi:citrate lyase gamma subunit
MSSPALPPTQQTNPTPSQAELEYRSLREHFERLVRWSSIAISTIVVVAGALLYNSVSDARKDASQAIQASRESADREISTIQKAAVDTAKAEAQKAIDAAFEKQNVQRMIENTAQKKVDAAVEAAVQKNLGARIEAFKSLLNDIGEISNHGAQLRLGFRPGLDYLVKAKQSADSTVRAYASSTLTEIAADYEVAATQRAAAFNPQNKPDFFLLAFASTPKALMNVIRHQPDPLAPEIISSAFLDMKKRVGWDVPMFDISAAERWCAQHKPKCEE